MASAPETSGQSPPDQKPPSENPPPAEKEKQPPPPRRRGQPGLIIGLVLGVIVIIGVLWYYNVFIAPFESTDDAFIEGRVTTISPRVTGPVVRLLIDDNQKVKAGDLLLEIDPNDYDVQLAQAQAALAVARSQLEQAKAQTVVDQAKADQAQASVSAADANAQRAKADLERYQASAVQSVSRSQVDLAQAQAQTSTADVEVARNAAKAATAQVAYSHTVVESSAAQVVRDEALVRQAELQLGYTKIFAPVDGRVTRRSIEKGDYVQVGQALLALVPDEVWVVANFKETQLKLLRPGQPVTLSIDAYPQRKFKGKVDSLQAGSGARFSLLPPENAVGNYVKVVQRIPVKILFDEPLPPEFDVAPGLSVEPEVRVK